MNYNTDLQAKNTELQSILDTINALPEAETVQEVEQATPTITVSSGGLITATATQSAGKVAAGTKSATRQLTTKSAQTYTPGTSNQTISSGRYLTGTQTIKGDANLKPENIVAEVTIFGVTGTAQSGGGGDELEALVTGTITSIVSQATEIRQYLFRDTALETASFPNATEMGAYAFYSCDNLVSVELPKVKTMGSQPFYMCMKLAEIVMPRLTATVSNAFGNCIKLAKADFTDLATIAASTFSNGSALETLILRGSSVVTLANTSAFTNTKIKSGGTGYIYVPSALVDSYKAATNWSTFASQFRAIEDYPEITGG